MLYVEEKIRDCFSRQGVARYVCSFALLTPLTRYAALRSSLSIKDKQKIWQQYKLIELEHLGDRIG